MPTTKSQLLPNESIQVFLDGFCFCTPTHQAFIALSDLPNAPESALENKIKEAFASDQPALIYFDQPAQFVPQTLFDQRHSENYYKHYHRIPKGYALQDAKTTDQKHHLLYPVANQWADFFGKTLPNATPQHYQHLLYTLAQTHSESVAKKQLYIHLQHGFFELFLFEAGQLLFTNRFAQDKVDTFLYFLFYVVETLALDQQNFDLLFLGKYSRFEAYYLGVANFHENLQYLYPNDNEPALALPAPFFSTL